MNARLEERRHLAIVRWEAAQAEAQAAGMDDDPPNVVRGSE